ncbi:MAG: hypothetical protein LBT46_04840 [Planctomycetaceae bacterium]|nr:hypothetical protein [Planctomycetaceae bacterium]
MSKEAWIKSLLSCFEYVMQALKVSSTTATTTTATTTTATTATDSDPVKPVERPVERSPGSTHRRHNH